MRLEYRVDFARARGKTSSKVFQISETEIEDNSKAVTRRHRFADLSTRRHYAGPHRVAVLVNGVEKAVAGFVLVDG